MNRRERRNRIFRPQQQGEVVVDSEAWHENCSSNNVRHHTNFVETLQVEFWYDKHYWDRLHKGDGDGEREGIEFEFVEPLVIKSYKYLMYYALKHRDLLFVNHPPPKDRRRNLRVVLRQKFDDKETLNVVVEYHFISLNKLEVTIVTAMSKEGFNLGDNQYAIEFIDDDSTLYRLVNSKVVEVDSYRAEE
ncbi:MULTISPECIES: hypothetical protein [Flavobacterium]|uniref:Uncharacterized protein n=1 Tax=Flavobacterium hankyongi TaxID=1176532 RepID=A0ABP8ZS66_9FLAO|nr:hypothetical protein [Flavobacterium sp. N1846]